MDRAVYVTYCHVLTSGKGALRALAVPTLSARHRSKTWFLSRPFWLLWAMLLVGCQAALPGNPPETAHLTGPESAAPIPNVVQVPPPASSSAKKFSDDLYTVVGNGVAARDLLFALARDAGLNLDLHPGVSGTVTVNAVDQPLSQILQRIARQAGLRIEIADSHLVVQPDRPYLRSYPVDYVNLVRRSQGAVSVSTQIASTGTGAVTDKSARGGASTSTTTVLQESANQFWDTLVSNVRGLLGLKEDAADSVLVNKESALLTVLATDRQHEAIGRLLDEVLARARRQVLIEATVVEVELSDRFQAGVDWSMVDQDNGVRINQQSLAGNLASPPVTTLTLDKTGVYDLMGTIKLLERFGSLRVLSSPKIMSLNNQTAMLKVVDNRVYFTIDVDIQAGTDNSPSITTYETNVHTIPVGFIMAVTPQIAANHEVTLNVRPTITRVLGFVRDPNPALANAGVISEIPEIQVREVESVLKVASGQIAVLGGLMQDSSSRSRQGIPVLSRIPIIGQLFSYRDEEVRKTELVVFLRPTVITGTPLQGALPPHAFGITEENGS